jgi:hypothetical protein
VVANNRNRYNITIPKNLRDKINVNTIENQIVSVLGRSTNIPYMRVNGTETFMVQAMEIINEAI